MSRWLASVVVVLVAVCPRAIAQEQQPAPAPAPVTEAMTYGADRVGYSMLPYFQEDALIMHRATGTADFGSSNWAAGPRFLLGIPLGESTAFEMGYFGIYGMNSSASDPLVTATVAGITATANNNSVIYHAFMQNAELNVRRFLTPEFSLAAGFRYVNWHEHVDASYNLNNFIPGVTLPPGATTQIYHTSNNLYGFQVGGDWNGMITDRLGLDLGLKTGIFGASTNMDASLNIPGIVSVGTNAGATRAAFVGEIGLIGTYKLTDYLKVRAGYQVMWVEGIALAPDQANTANFGGVSTVSNRGGVFVHGAVVGLEYRW